MRHPPPPSRYRIYERDRRLVVVDNWAGGRPDQAMSAPIMPAREGLQAAPGKLNRVAFDGRTAFTSHALFDANGPRTIVLDPGSATLIKRLKPAAAVVIAILVFAAVTAPYLLLPLFLLLQRKPRERIRGAITAWLDRAAL